MGAAIAVLMFLAFVALDYVLNRKREAAAVASATATDPGILPGLEPVWVAGYEQPEELYYHPAHTWAQVVSNDTVAVGVDDFAGKAVPAEAAKMPEGGEEAVAVLVQLGERRADAMTLVQRVLAVAPELNTPEAIIQQAYKLKAGGR